MSLPMNHRPFIFCRTGYCAKCPSVVAGVQCPHDCHVKAKVA